MRYIYFLGFFFIIISGCHSNTGISKKSNDTISIDPVLVDKTAIVVSQKFQQHPIEKEVNVEGNEERDTSSDIFKQDTSLHPVDPYNTFIISGTDKIRLSSYEFWGLFGKWDFDHDGKEELLITFTPSAGRYSTAVYFIYEPIARNMFKLTAKLTTGSSENYRSKEEFPFEMTGKMFPFFFTDTETDDFPEPGKEDSLRLNDLTFIYKNNRFVLNNNYEELNKNILFNLKWMQTNASCDTITLSDEEKREGNDYGFRRVFCYEVVSYYIMTRDLSKTKDLFYKYYPCSDMDRVWNELKERIKSLLKDNTF